MHQGKWCGGLAEWSEGNTLYLSVAFTWELDRAYSMALFARAGDGGVLDWHEEELTRMAGTDWQKREACKMAAWIKPKMAHKHMVQKLLQVRAHLILCFRAEEKIEMVKEGGKVKIVPKQSRTGLDGWIPICEKSLPFELTASFLLTADAPGIPRPIKLQEQHRALFPLDKPITEESGRRIAEWASGASKAPPMSSAVPPPDRAASAPDSSPSAFLDAGQIAKITEALDMTGIPVERLLAKVQQPSIDRIPADMFDRAMGWINKAADKAAA